MRIPPYLKQGDRIGLAATARKVSPEEMAAARSYLESWGLEVVHAANLYDSCDQFAGDDAARAHGLQELLDDPSVKAVLFARGGYGTVRMIDRLRFDALEHSPKWLCGFSDLTILHSHLQRHLKLASLHSPMAINMQAALADAESIEAMRRALFGLPVDYQIASDEMNRNGTATARLCGGNLSVLYSAIGSASDLNTDGTILFLEDLDEYLYHLDRMMMNLNRTGKLGRLAGLVVGGMGEMKDNAIPFGRDAYSIIAEHTARYDYPVCFGFPAGHDRRNLALILGGNHRLEVSENSCRLSFAGD